MEGDHEEEKITIEPSHQEVSNNSTKDNSILKLTKLLRQVMKPILVISSQASNPLMSLSACDFEKPWVLDSGVNRHEKESIIVTQL